jgi:hypothetical protein
MDGCSKGNLGNVGARGLLRDLDYWFCYQHYNLLISRNRVVSGYYWAKTYMVVGYS